MSARKRFYHFLRVLLFTLPPAVGGVTTASAADAVYNVEILPAFCCGAGFARDVNELGVAVGKARGDSGGENVDITSTWDVDGQLNRIDLNEQAFYSNGRAINDLGDVVGQFDDRIPSLWVNQQRTALTGPLGTFLGYPNAIDNNGVIVGCMSESGLAGGPFIPVQWVGSPNGEVIPGTPAESKACAYAINNIGHVTGRATIGGVFHAVIWADGVMIDLGIPQGFASCVGNGINDADWVAGSCADSEGNSRPVLWRDGATVELAIAPGEPGIAHDVNNNGEVLGYAGIRFAGGGAFVWRDGVIQDLSGLTNGRELLAINDNGVIVGGAYRLTPEPQDTDADGVADINDNCTFVANPMQRDTDGDGFGNYCDPDFDNNGTVNASDLFYLKSNFFSADPDADLDGNGLVNASDLFILKSMFFGPPGPVVTIN